MPASRWSLPASRWSFSPMHWASKGLRRPLDLCVCHPCAGQVIPGVAMSVDMYAMKFRKLGLMKKGSWSFADITCLPWWDDPPMVMAQGQALAAPASPCPSSRRLSRNQPFGNGNHRIYKEMTGGWFNYSAYIIIYQNILIWYIDNETIEKWFTIVLSTCTIILATLLVGSKPVQAANCWDLTMETGAPTVNWSSRSRSDAHSSGVFPDTTNK